MGVLVYFFDASLCFYIGIWVIKNPLNKSKGFNGLKVYYEIYFYKPFSIDFKLLSNILTNELLFLKGLLMRNLGLSIIFTKSGKAEAFLCKYLLRASCNSGKALINVSNDFSSLRFHPSNIDQGILIHFENDMFFAAILLIFFL